MHFSPILTFTLGVLIVGVLAAEVRNLVVSTWAYLVHSLFLACTIGAFAILTGHNQLYYWVLATLITKVGFIPLMLRWYIINHQATEVRPLMGFRLSLTVLSLVLIGFFKIVHTYLDFVAPTEIATLEPYRSSLAVALTVFALALYILVTRRDAVKNVIGVCLLENGAHLSLVILAPTLPETVLLGITSSIVVSAGMLIYITARVYDVIGTADTFKLSRLRG